MKNFTKLLLTSILGITLFASAANAADHAGKKHHKKHTAKAHKAHKVKAHKTTNENEGNQKTVIQQPAE
jgi:hypothetical protein